jgi:SOS-response transcriptional repressor LexA
LTRAELEVLAAFEDLGEKLGHPPTYSEWLVELGWRSRGSLHQYVERLRAKGVLTGRRRSLRLVVVADQNRSSDLGVGKPAIRS